MKSGELKKLAKAYATHFPTPWQHVGNEFMRRDGDWVQIISFNASRFDDSRAKSRRKHSKLLFHPEA